jgi:hypothetical protein
MLTKRHVVGRGSRKTIRELLAEGKTLRLRPSTYSDKGMTDGNFLNLQPYKGGWIVSFQGEHLGSIKRKKGGWDTSGVHMYGNRAEKIAEATSMLDEYYAAGGA